MIYLLEEVTIMRNILRISVLAAMAIGQVACASAQMDPADPANALILNRKVTCSTVDAEPVTYWWEGRAYGRRQGERDIHLFDVEGMNVRACSTITDPDRGTGYAMVSREILLYKDKDTGEVLSTWDNPYTGETVDVLHVANDPVNFEAYEKNRDGSPATFGGVLKDGHWWMKNTVPLWYPNPLGGDYQKEVGGTYHATELFNFFGQVDSLVSEDTTTAPTTVGWSRMSDWLPWMNMNGREGLFWVHTAGAKLNSWDDMSETMKNEIRTNYPEYVAPPPTGDPRDNMTSWKYYDLVKKGEIEPPVRD